MDFGFSVAAELRGDDVARRLQLFLEYEPEPPFDINVHSAPPELIAEIRAAAAPMLKERLRSSERAMARLNEKARAAEAA